MKILVSGATGFIGRSLIPALQKAGHQVYALVRKTDSRLDKSIPQFTINTLAELSEPMDVLINLAGEGIADKPWSKKRKQILFDSRVKLTKQIQQALKHCPKLIISMSAVGLYGSDSNQTYHEETTLPTDGFAHEICQAWEEAAHDFATHGARLVIFRLGVVLGPNGGALDKMRPAYLFGLGGKIGRGNQWFSWVHIDDVIKAINQALSDEKMQGAYNLVAPELIQQKTFAKSFATSLNRPAIFPLPAFILELTLGDMASLLTKGPKILPTRLTNEGFEFAYPTIDSALIAVQNQR
ncbi:Epimerase family protein [Marinomonas spartinae]|uniref:Epimerase family protein n=1 Tax=Marinomonas spartinae TaxID=1792290 RepID=A0A1A8TMV0_9GAMM|nr:TIGR01777 family oxidoreductase [Marinomonas spartinae]SBS33953.1 Epimerase family protein [Marinomonas spartinae]SBS37944.1 Epimerase family protein [Marinomonas spartinae]